MFGDVLLQFEQLTAWLDIRFEMETPACSDVLIVFPIGLIK